MVIRSLCTVTLSHGAGNVLSKQTL